jgi:hypothetical protein
MQGSRLDLAAAFGAGDLRPRDLALAVLVSLAAHAAVFVAGRAVVPPREERASSAWGIKEEAPIPVSVVDMSPDGRLLKLGDARAQARRSAGRPPATPPPASRGERADGASEQASKGPESPPAPKEKAAPAGDPPPPLGTEPSKQVDATATPTPDADPASGEAGPGSPEGAPEGTETDPLKARAVDLYRARLIAWFSSRFRVSGSGLSPDELTRYKVSATVHLSSERQIESFSIDTSGNAAFDAAARAALEGARGQALPPPPESYPDIVQRTIRLTFVCRSDQCD